MDKKLTTNITRPNYPCQLLTVREVAEILSISKSFAYQLINAGEIPYVKIGSAKRVKTEDLTVYINDNTSQPGGPSEW